MAEVELKYDAVSTATCCLAKIDDAFNNTSPDVVNQVFGIGFEVPEDLAEGVDRYLTEQVDIKYRRHHDTKFDFCKTRQVAGGPLEWVEPPPQGVDLHHVDVEAQVVIDDGIAAPVEKAL